MTGLAEFTLAHASWLLPLPLVLPLLALGLSLTLPRQQIWQQSMGLLAAAGMAITGGLLLNASGQNSLPLVRLGDWPAPVGIPLTADPLTALMLVLAGIMTAISLIYTAGDRERHAFFVPLLMVTILGVNGAFLTRDLFNLYVWFEVLLAGSFGLLVVSGGRHGREAAVKSLTLNLLGSLIFLVAVGVTYGLAGTLDMFALQERLSIIHEQRPAAVTGVAMLLAVAFSVKAALFPFHFWLPASYHIPQAGVSALFAALLTKVGVYSLLRLLTLPFAAVQGPELVLGILAAVTMLFGVFGAVSRFEMRGILAWHSISQVGYMVVGLALLSAPTTEMRVAGIAATVFFIIHHGLVKPALFLVAGLVARYQGTTELKKNGGLYLKRPLLAVVFLLAALSLAGIPPLSGFWAKLAVIQASLGAGLGWLAAAALAAGLVTLLSMVKIWNEAFWKPIPESAAQPTVNPGDLRARWTATLALTALITLIGLQPRPLLEWSHKAAVSVIADRDLVQDQEVSP